MNFLFKLTKKEQKEDILTRLNLLIPLDNNYRICFKIAEYEYAYYTQIYIETDTETQCLSEIKHGHPGSSTLKKIRSLLVYTNDQLWDLGLDYYRKSMQNTPPKAETKQEVDLNHAKDELRKYKAIHGGDYAKQYYTRQERKCLKKAGYYDFVVTGFFGEPHTFFERILNKMNNGGKIEFEKLLQLTLGYNDYVLGKSDNIFYYAEPQLSAETVKKLREISLIDAKTDNTLLDVQKIVKEEIENFNHICQVTVNKKKDLLKKSLEDEKIKYMVNNGFSLTESFYYVNNDLQKKKETILDYYLALTDNLQITDPDEVLLNVAKYLKENVNKSNIERVIDYVLMDCDEDEYLYLGPEMVDHISFLRLKVKNILHEADACLEDAKALENSEPELENSEQNPKEESKEPVSE